MKEIIIYHDTDSNTTLLVVDGKLFGCGVNSISFEHKGGERASMALCIEPKYFEPDSKAAEELKKRGFPFNMRNSTSKTSRRKK